MARKAIKGLLRLKDSKKSSMANVPNREVSCDNTTFKRSDRTPIPKRHLRGLQKL